MRKLKQKVILTLELVGDFRPSQQEFYDKLQEFTAQIIHEIDLIQCDLEWTRIYTDYNEITPVEIHCTTSLSKIEEEE